MHTTFRRRLPAALAFALAASLLSAAPVIAADNGAKPEAARRPRRPRRPSSPTPCWPPSTASRMTEGDVELAEQRSRLPVRAASAGPEARRRAVRADRDPAGRRQGPVRGSRQGHRLQAADGVPARAHPAQRLCRQEDRAIRSPTTSCAPATTRKSPTRRRSTRSTRATSWSKTKEEAEDDHQAARRRRRFRRTRQEEVARTARPPTAATSAISAPARWCRHSRRPPSR